MNSFRGFDGQDGAWPWKKTAAFLVMDVQFEVLARQRAISLSFTFSCFQYSAWLKKRNLEHGPQDPKRFHDISDDSPFLTLPFSTPSPGPANRFEHGCPI